MLKKKKKSQVNSQKRKKDFLAWIFWCTNNALTLSLRRNNIDLWDPKAILEYIYKRYDKVK